MNKRDKCTMPDAPDSFIEAIESGAERIRSYEHRRRHGGGKRLFCHRPPSLQIKVCASGESYASSASISSGVRSRCMARLRA